ncbi:hypothetical protein V2G26_021253 [Clonostachys chloroleuca]
MGKSTLEYVKDLKDKINEGSSSLNDWSALKQDHPLPDDQLQCKSLPQPCEGKKQRVENTIVDTYACDCGWSGPADAIQFDKTHVMNVDGVLTSHVKGSTQQMYRCRVKDFGKLCNYQGTLGGFATHLNKKHVFLDNKCGELKDAYRPYIKIV